MKKLILAVGLMTLTGTALAAKPCEDLKSEIDSKLQDKGVTGYVLEVVDNGAGGGKVIGRCDGGNREIVYRRE
ncbi:DUF1161 domain-containing protein [Pseudomonas capeferrum]|uniref:DUF1161 domain-containing protein n=1 Tax=Pseudomonas capeferrum TaxID=1495066 RepID=UPI0015E4177F|nr:DUF1161 domain-containing protein [Pseudomonas capeferrum]MBA1203886.1 DUF1161 domain-containing protein [Pseudomonas capeferrum]